MAKSDLLKEAIADAKAVRETALANAKIALQEAFAPRIQSMLSAKLAEELEDEESAAGLEAGAEDMEAGAEDLEAGAAELEAGAGNDVGDLSIDVDGDGEFDEFDIMSNEPMAGEEEMGAEAGMEGEAEPEADYEDEGMEEDLNLEEILRELEMPMGDEGADHMTGEEEPAMEEGAEMGHDEEENIDEIIEAILRETEEMEAPAGDASQLEEENAELKDELEEAYNTVKHLKSVINEVNLLNAKLLYTNKLFRNFDLNESQKMKVIENFDRAANTREAKLVFATLAESFNKPKLTPKRKMVKESIASKPVATTAPSKETTQILSEGFEMANRWKKLAGLI
jgi:hypothetical protein